MKKIRNVENPFEFETVVFSFSEEQILRELIAESSYVAKSLVGQSDILMSSVFVSILSSIPLSISLQIGRASCRERV